MHAARDVLAKAIHPWCWDERYDGLPDHHDAIGFRKSSIAKAERQLAALSTAGFVVVDDWRPIESLEL